MLVGVKTPSNRVVCVVVSSVNMYYAGERNREEESNENEGVLLCKNVGLVTMCAKST